jgi:hypothetical protein
VDEEELEARGAKYNCDRIVRLASGRFALFAAWSQDDGISLITIGTLEELAPMIHTTEEIDAHNPTTLPAFDPDELAYASKGKGTVMDLIGLLGLGKKAEPIKRRI